MQQLLTVAFAVVLLGGCECNLLRDVLYDVNSLLVCHVQNPLANLPGQPALVEGIETIPLVPNYRNAVWLPQESGFTFPAVVGGPALDQSKLLDFLGKDKYNGQYFIYQSQPNPDLLQQRTTPPPAVPSYLVDGQPMLLSRSELSGTSPQFENFIDYLLNITQSTNSSTIVSSLKGFGIGDCPLASTWTTLPPTFFPNVFYGSYCPNNTKNAGYCSIPKGLICRPDLRPKYLAYEFVLRWDCCTTYVNKKWTYSCGWRKVKFPIVAKCFCGCDEFTLPELPFLG